MTRDLDGADLAEVRRRVVEPALACALQPGELEHVLVHFGAPSWCPHVDREGPRAVSLLVVAKGEELERHVTSATFERDDAQCLADDLAGELEEWVCETSFGWGRLRETPLGPVPPAWWADQPAVPRLLEVYPEEGVPSPVWERGVNLPLDALPLLPDLSAALLAWQQRWAELWDEDATVPWLQVVDALEPERRRLVAALRLALPEVVVAEPVPLDELSRR